MTALALSNDGRLLAAADQDGTLQLWDIAQAKRMATIQAHAGPVWALAFSHGDNMLLASGPHCLRVKISLRAKSTAPTSFVAHVW